MSVIYIVLPLALFVILIAVLAYVWAAKRGQFDDLTTPAIRVLHDDAPVKVAEPRPPAHGIEGEGGNAVEP